MFLFIVPLYGAIATRVTRIKLINTVTTFFIVTLLLFFALVSAGAYPTAVAVTFYLWIGVFSLMVIAQFWSFANDLYTPEQGKRLFAIVGFGDLSAQPSAPCSRHNWPASLVSDR